MKKETLLEIIFGTIGGIVFGIGMCMALIPEWHLFQLGIVVGLIGFLILLCIIPIYRKGHPRKIKDSINWGKVMVWVIGIIGSLCLGFGMSRIMTGNPTSTDIILGLGFGIVGLIVCVLVYPIYAYIKGNNKLC